MTSCKCRKYECDLVPGGNLSLTASNLKTLSVTINEPCHGRIIGETTNTGDEEIIKIITIRSASGCAISWVFMLWSIRLTYTSQLNTAWVAVSASAVVQVAIGTVHWSWLVPSQWWGPPEDGVLMPEPWWGSCSELCSEDEGELDPSAGESHRTGLLVLLGLVKAVRGNLLGSHLVIPRRGWEPAFVRYERLY